MCKTVLATMLVLAAAMLPAAQAPAPVAGVVFEDANGNGRRDSGSGDLPALRFPISARSSRPAPTVRIGSPAPDTASCSSAFRMVTVRSGHSGSRFRIGWARARGLRPDRTHEPAEFTFIHASDTHVSQQSLERLQQFRQIAEARRPDFVLVSGDLVRDALRVGEEEARGYYDLYRR